MEFESHFGIESSGAENKRLIKIIMIAAGLAALVYIATFHYLDSKRQVIFKGTCVKEEAFILGFKRAGQTKEKFWILNLRPGRIQIETDQNIDKAELVTTDPVPLEADRVNARSFRIDIGNNLVLRSIRFSPRDRDIAGINVIVFRKATLSPLMVAFQCTFLFILVGVGLSIVLALYSLIIERRISNSLVFPTSVRLFLMLILVVLLFFIVNVGKIADFAGRPAPLRLMGTSFLFNLVLALFLVALFLAIASRLRGRNIPWPVPALAALPIIFYRIPFDVKAIADGVLWVLNLSQGKMDLSFAESLSLLLNKLAFRYARALISIDAKTALIYCGKIMGLLFIVSLFCLINSFEEFSSKKKLLLFFLLLTFGFNVLLFGLPEFRYYPLPFLVFSIIWARKYIQGGDSAKPLILSTFFAFIAGLLHGSAFFSFPVLLLLPLIKYGRAEGGRWLSLYIKTYTSVLITAGMTLLTYLMIVRALGFNLLFNTMSGGFDGRRFISFLPRSSHFPWAVNFLEIGYFVSIGWIFFITGAFVFLAFPSRWKNLAPFTKLDFVLFLFGISQFMIVLFWGFDLGIREFDLYIAPTTLIYLFLTKSLIGKIPDDKSAWKYILVFSLFSPACLLANMAL